MSQPLPARLTADDADELAAFFELLAATPAVTRFFHPHPLTRSCAEKLCARGGRDRYFLWRFRHRVVGYSMLRGWDEGYEIPSAGMCGHPALQDAGLGQAMLAHSIAECRGAGAEKLRMSVHRDNARSIHVYAKLGFAFREQDAETLVGMRDLATPLPPLRALDMARLEAFAARP